MYFGQGNMMIPKRSDFLSHITESPQVSQAPMADPGFDAQLQSGLNRRFGDHKNRVTIQTYAEGKKLAYDLKESAKVITRMLGGSSAAQFVQEGEKIVQDVYQGRRSFTEGQKAIVNLAEQLNEQVNTSVNRRMAPATRRQYGQPVSYF